MSTYPKAIQKLIDQFTALPGLGPKTAERLVFYLLDIDYSGFTAALQNAQGKIKHCEVCFNFADQTTCAVCADSKRNSSVLAIVAKPQDVEVMERSHAYSGRYFILGGLLSPIAGVTPDDIRLKDLMARLDKEKNMAEILLAFDNSVEGESTAIYLAKLLKQKNVKVTRLARGLPVGSDLEYADEVTLKDAIEHRWEL